MARYNTVSTTSQTSGNGTVIVTPSSGLVTTFTTAAGTVTLPNPVNYPGIVQSFWNNSGGTITLSSPSGNIKGTGLTAATSQTFPNQAFFMIASDGTDYILMSNEGGPLVGSTGTFGGTLTANGSLVANSIVTLSPVGQSVTISPSGASGSVTISPAASSLTLGTAGQAEVHQGNMTATTANQVLNFSPTGSGTVTIGGNSSGAVTISPTGAGSLAINPTTTGAINNMTIGASTRSSGAFTTLTASSITTLTGGVASTTTTTGTLQVTGGIGVTGQITTATLVETSSIAFKENVNPITDGLNAILQLVGVTYDRKDTHQHEAGLIAEEVYKIIPDLVSLDKNGKPYGIQYTKLTAYLIESIKALNEKIDSLTNSK